MFGKSIRLPFSIAGIPIRLDSSFLLVLPLFAWLIASQVPEFASLLQDAGYQIDQDALTGGWTPTWLGIIAAVGLFTSVLIHELGHAFTARLFDVEVEGITLWFLGGVAQFPEMPKERGREAVVAIAGPITSILLAAGFYLLWTVPDWGAPALFVASYLTITNAALAVFNMLPALPLDGGRVLRSLLAIPMSYLRATQISASISRVVAILLGIYGILTFQLFIALIAFFVYTAVRAEAQQAVISEVFEGVTVGDIMTRDPITVEPDTTLRDVGRLSEYRKHTGYPVVDDEGKVVGVMKLQDARTEDEAGRAPEHVREVMHEPETISPSEEIPEALKRLAQSPLGRLAVVDDRGELVGVLSKSDIVREPQERAGE
jgi:Zn-dependent protease